MNQRLALLYALALTGCATPKAPPPPPSPAPICLPTKNYTPAQDAALEALIHPLDPSSPIILYLLDYKHLRDAARAACGQPQAANLPTPPKVENPDRSPPVQRFMIEGPLVLPS